MTGANPFDMLHRALATDASASSDFDLNPEVRLPEGRSLRPAAVLVAFMETGQGIQLVLTKRSSALRHHPGQIAFPGGKLDKADNGPDAAALREAHEEIGLMPKNVEVMGRLAPHETVTGFSVVPVIARVKAPFDPVPEPGEVAEVFNVPFSHIADRQNYYVQSRMWGGRPRYYYAVPFGPYYIWGATARILRGLADRMEQCA